MKQITLDRQEFFLGAQTGIIRNIASIMRDGENRHGMEEEDRWWTAIEGACGEIAFAKAYGLYFHAGVDQSKKDMRSDVAGYDVKTMSVLWYQLRIRPDEAKLPRWYALVCGAAPTFQVHGCFYGPDVLQHPDWLKDLPSKDPKAKKRPPAYLVPMAALRPVTGPAPTVSAASAPSPGARPLLPARP